MTVTLKLTDAITVRELMTALKELEPTKPVLISINGERPAPNLMSVVKGQECVLLYDRVPDPKEIKPMIIVCEKKKTHILRPI